MERMELQLRKKFPKGALSFYIQLYCKRKGDIVKKSVQKEAMKSWISLNKSEKQFFETKYNDYRSNYKKSIAMRLKNAEPYLKTKVGKLDVRNSMQNVIVNIGDKDKDMAQNELLLSKIEVDANEECANHTPDTQNIEKVTNLDLHDSYHDISNIGSPIPTTQDEGLAIPEPTAPKIMTGKELFLIIKEREENDLVWEELTNPEKRRYSNAVLAIKRNYLKQYREYLDHLSPKKLFNHYRNIVNSVGIDL